MKERVFVTGLGAVTASGATLDETWSSLLAGKTGIDEIKQDNLSTWDNRLGGEIKAYQLAQMLPDRKLMKMISRQDVLGINAVMQAVAHSQLMTYRDSIVTDAQALSAFQDSTGVFVGSPGNKFVQEYDFLPLLAKAKGNMQAFAAGLFDEVHPMWLLRILPNNVLAYTGITYGFKGANHNVTNHAVGGMQAILEAYRAIQSGQVARAVVVGYDVATEPQVLYYFDKLGLLSHTDLKPFNATHDGTVLAEGAAALVLESETSVKQRQAKCYAELTGGFSHTEGQGLFSIDASGAALTRLLSQSLNGSAILPGDVGFVVAHGNGNQHSDCSEAKAIQAVFPHHDVPVTAFKWCTGHTLCAAGVIDAVLAIEALRTASIPGIANLTQLAETCAPLAVSATARRLTRKNTHALIINRGFASMNASLLLKACDDVVNEPR